jgi:DNA-binding transcriptional LysR family regulator
MITYMRNFGASVLSQVPPRSHPKEVVHVQRVNTALSMLRVRQGAMVCPSMTGSLVQGFGLTFLPLRQPVVSRSIAVFARKRNALSPAIESFLKFTLNFAKTWVAVAQETGRTQQEGRRKS